MSTQDFLLPDLNGEEDEDQQHNQMKEVFESGTEALGTEKEKGTGTLAVCKEGSSTQMSHDQMKEQDGDNVQEMHADIDSPPGHGADEDTGNRIGKSSDIDQYEDERRPDLRRSSSVHTPPKSPSPMEEEEDEELAEEDEEDELQGEME